MPYVGRPHIGCDECGGIVPAIECPHYMLRIDNIDAHPLRYSALAQTIEKILTTRLHHERLDGYTLETSLAIAAAIVGVRR